MPKSELNGQGRRAFEERRDLLFQRCTAQEQQCLMKLTVPFERLRAEVLVRPNIFTEAYVAAMKRQLFPWANPQPMYFVRVLAPIAGVLNRVDRFLAGRAQSNFVASMRSAAGADNDDVLAGVANFFRELPVQIGFNAQRELEARLDAVIAKSLSDSRVSALRRFTAVQRTLQAGSRGHGSQDAGKRIWSLLLEVATQDIDAAVRLVDELWDQQPPVNVLFAVNLHESPELAYRLAIAFKPHRADFATDMLRESIIFSSFQFTRLAPSAVAAMDQVMDESCRLLANWSMGNDRITRRCALRAMSCALQYGNPGDEYWTRIPRECLTIVKSLPAESQREWLRIVAQTAFYGGDPAFVEEAHQFFLECIERILTRQQGSSGEIDQNVRHVTGALSVLEDKALSFRNRRIPANQRHPLLGTVEVHLDAFLERLRASEPGCAIRNTVSMTLALQNEHLLRKYHQILRDEFESCARSAPADAGLALKALIQYCGFSQLDDEMYRKTLCKESFDALIPILERISSSDAAVARTGIGWSPRGDI